ncbi:DnaJ C-terminal domain-containing protein [Kitasatospora sp. NPDC008115]|uniref:DnaJ C-terminal domain-containing protein n=1 Tax=Kitasatospora sp. NPDC008115 TaxID=3364022 RepID=UPI0036E72964
MNESMPPPCGHPIGAGLSPGVAETPRRPVASDSQDLSDAIRREGVRRGTGARCGFCCSQRVMCTPQIRWRITLSQEEARHGATVPLRQNARSTCPDCAGDPRRQDKGWCSLCRGIGLVPKRVQEHRVRFPAGLREGQRVRLRGLGERGTNGGDNGDLYVTVHIEP